MKIINKLTFAALAVLAATLLIQTSITQAADNLPTFTKITTGPVVTDMESSAGFAWLDADNDNRFLDLFISNGFEGPDQNLLYHNDGNENRWLKVKLVGRASNRSGIGAKVRISAVLNRNLNPNSTWQMREISGNSASSGWQGLVGHFGAGEATRVM